MSLSSPQVESIIEFTPISQHDHDHGQTLNNNNDHNHIRVNNNINRPIVIEPIEKPFDWELLVIILRLALVGTLIVGVSLRETKVNKPKTIPNPPRIFINKLDIPEIKIIDGELSAIWEITLTISNVMNATINIGRLDTTLCYKEDDTLAWKTPILRKYDVNSPIFSLIGNDAKKVHFKLNTTGWEKDQAVVDDSVIQSIAQDMQKGNTRFSLHMLVLGEVESSDGWVLPFGMFPICKTLGVKFERDDHKGETGTMIDSNPIECLGIVEWEEERMG
ncbi:unnamed protein product [Lathyrus sativus]|nr:unnamed protein product [Lathyrus sativus]